jgi:tripartite-type tricarboxylate transporter receptor subunit TctC
MLQGPSFIFVAESSPIKTWKDFEEKVRANPGKLKVATLGFGSVDDFALSVIAKKGLNFVQVPFSKPNERYVSILGGHADALYEQAGDVAQFIQNKQMRPILMFGKERLSAFKDVPTSYELGFQVALPQFRSIVMRGGTPADRVKKVSDTLAKIAATEEYKKFLKDQYAAEDSFIDASKATKFIADQLDEMKKAMAAN